MTLPNVPYLHFIIALPPDPSIPLLQNKLEQLMEMTTSALAGVTTAINYNFILIKEWMMVTPHPPRPRWGSVNERRRNDGLDVGQG